MAKHVTVRIGTAHLLLLVWFGLASSSAFAAPNNHAPTQKQIAAETLFLRQTRAFNQQLLVFVAAVRQARTRKEFDELDMREQKQNNLKLDEWFQARSVCFHAGVRDDPNEWPDLNRELTLTYQLLDQLTKTVHHFVPEMTTSDQDPF